MQKYRALAVLHWHSAHVINFVPEPPKRGNSNSKPELDFQSIAVGHPQRLDHLVILALGRTCFAEVGDSLSVIQIAARIIG